MNVEHFVDTLASTSARALPFMLRSSATSFSGSASQTATRVLPTTWCWASSGVVVGHQFKTSKFPGTFTVETLFTGANGLLRPLVHAWQCLRKDNPGSRVEIHLVVNDFPSITDKPGDGTPAHSAAFLEEFQQHPNRLASEDWYTQEWSRLINHLRREAGLER
ncbi:MAG: hypothetical protein LKM38_17055 [Pseudomonas veronii]|nr:hypothetical protein [Pseudomonas veronii]